MKFGLSALGLLLTAACTGQNADAPNMKSTQTTEQPAADNTAMNERDRHAEAPTSGDQGSSEADRTITQQIRQGVVAEDALSTTGKNVKIITADGVVTLRGPVSTAEEKSAIARIVHKVDGVKRVDNQLEIATK